MGSSTQDYIEHLKEKHSETLPEIDLTEIKTIQSIPEIQKRQGVVMIPHELLRGLTENVLKAIFSNIFPLFIEEKPSFQRDAPHRYYCLSPLFDIVEEGMVIPEYVLKINTNIGFIGNVEVTAEKQTNG